VTSRTIPILAFTLLGAVVGFLLGFAGRDGFGRTGTDRSTTTERADSRRAPLTVAEAAELKRKARQAEVLLQENEALREQVARLTRPAAIEEILPEEEPGSRRKDGTIVGGARWPPQFMRTATAYVDQMFSQFIEEANLTPEQERRLREGLSIRITDIMQASADFTNGDLTADELYARAEEVSKTGLDDLTNLLDDGQMKVYDKFFGRTKTMIRDQVVHNEMTNLKAELKLDPEQEKHVRRIVTERYQRVQEKHGNPIPNIMFKPIRRAADGEIYDETATEIRKYLTADQSRRFDREERVAHEALFAYRSFLVPKVER
jgi:hypothetical protein